MTRKDLTYAAMEELSLHEMEKLSAASVERAITSKLNELEENDATRWRRFQAHTEQGSITCTDALRPLMRSMAKAMGLELFLTTPASVLEQFALSAVARKDDIETLLNLMIRSPMIAYAHPDTTTELVDRLNEIRDLCSPILDTYKLLEASNEKTSNELAMIDKPTLH